ncbi:ABC transporter ATP-binding protein [Aureimonas leprariae]|uniref:ABC transporter ATP-binding protein n=1 Tax=Plantimonas leprariae TaxID=2615207 RepID=A0A7V7PSV7_9HYPH|nr:ABC transporter ATP-binding protein [Aureimonas leprariae]KAB0682638.1 ABC transporter ATP-binding protein [Aureimonas leprariae]
MKAKASEPALRLRDIVKTFGKVEVLRGIDLEVGRGEFVVFVGPSGCGKSTLLRIIAGLDDQTSGTIEIGGRRVDGVEPARRGIAMVFQSYALYPHLTVGGNMGLALRQEGMRKAEIDGRVSKAAGLLQLAHLLERRPAELSGGQRQRVAIGRAIVRDPELFLFDEPLSNLDAALRVNTRIEIARLHRELGASMIYVTHDQIEAMTLADRIVVLNGGIVEQVGRPIDLYNKPANLFVAGFIGSPKMNFLTGAAAAPFDAPTIGIRPEHLRLAAEDEDHWGGQVRHVEHLGSDTYVYVGLGEGEELTVRLPGEQPVGIGETVRLTPEKGRVHRFYATGAAMQS